MDSDRLAALRREYAERGLEVADLSPTWHETFSRWLADAAEAGVPEPNAMVVASATDEAVPSARTVLLKGFDKRGFVFFTNLESRKGRELRANPKVAVVFPWHAIERQVLVQGEVSLVDREAVQAYFDTRPRLSQIAAWASPQSEVLSDRRELEQRFAEMTERFGTDSETRVPAPPNWGGLRVVPVSVEFWQGRRSRMHDRLRFRLDGDDWILERLAP